MAVEVDLIGSVWIAGVARCQLIPFRFLIYYGAKELTLSPQKLPTVPIRSVSLYLYAGFAL